MEPGTPQQADDDVGLALRPAREDGLKCGDAHRITANAKLTDDEERAKDSRFGTRG
jgi:hypothetical protein